MEENFVVEEPINTTPESMDPSSIPEAEEAIDATETDITSEDTKITHIEQEISGLGYQFDEIAHSKDPSSLFNTERYRELRSLGLSEREAYLATRISPREDNRAHLSASFAREAKTPSSTMPETELRRVRDLFEGMSDAEIRRLYKRVNA